MIPILFIGKNGNDGQKARDLGAKKVIASPEHAGRVFPGTYAAPEARRESAQATPGLQSE